MLLPVSNWSTSWLWVNSISLWANILNICFAQHRVIGLNIGLFKIMFRNHPAAPQTVV
jgi:hypothetical protein